MAFSSAVGYSNLPNGNFSPTIFSKKAQIAFRKKSVVQAITNNEYFGEISQYGDTVRIIKEPDVTVRDYKRGAQLVLQDLDDEELTLTVDQAKYFNFAIDDIEKKQSHVSFEEMAADKAAYRLKDTMDQNVLTYMTENVTTANTLGSTTPITVSFGTQSTTVMTPLRILNRLNRLMQVANVPEEDRWFVADPIFYELLGSEDSKLISRDYDDNGILRNGKVTTVKVRGFNLHESNNLPVAGLGPEGAHATNDYGWILAGQKSAVATAEQISKTEKYRPHQTFADAVKGLHLFGRKVLRPEALFAVKYKA